ncbi:hypothetical protein AQB9606_02332 [Aquabacterium sp. CECT 9606]|nr:hypothetical protein AQB9606_02332 [Aquabacterium sp. CECT 9606]
MGLIETTTVPLRSIRPLALPQVVDITLTMRIVTYNTNVLNASVKTMRMLKMIVFTITKINF